MIPHFNSIKGFNRYLNLKSPKKDLIDVVKYDDYDDLKLESAGITFDYYMIAFKRNMSDLRWYGNTEYDENSGFLYFLSPNQRIEWKSKNQWSGYHIMISPILLQEFNIDFNFFKYQISEALFLTEEEQMRVETLFEQINDEYLKDDYSMDLLMAYCNLFFTYVQKCYHRQFNSRQPLHNKLVVEFKKLLNTYYLDNPNQLPSVIYFAENLNLSPNYFSDLIKYHTGKTTIEIIHEKTISIAKKDLKSTNKPISEIGYSLGFEYPTYFSRLFKKFTGKTPTEFREINTSGNKSI
ncbi:helix-turn-helix domain-containing protein [Aquimarina algiphila]|uniref:helix-turn-helix domain-containing protein n=1 Tax=Aquimarina algiphila TaxID=2047982 RepID=UPI002490F0A5|nr:AraC family transcriptional regulator [Aquimarina algiphila]